MCLFVKNNLDLKNHQPLIIEKLGNFTHKYTDMFKMNVYLYVYTNKPYGQHIE